MLAPYWLPSAVPPSAPSADTGLLAGMRFDVRIDTAPDVQFETALTQNLQAEAHLTLRGTPANPGVLGRLNVTEGEIVFFGSKYTIGRGIDCILQSRPKSSRCSTSIWKPRPKA